MADNKKTESSQKSKDSKNKLPKNVNIKVIRKKKGIPSIQMRWYMKYFKWINISDSPDFQLNEYKFYDGNNDEIRF